MLTHWKFLRENSPQMITFFGREKIIVCFDDTILIQVNRSSNPFHYDDTNINS